jgi:hypothetical protein
MSNQNSQNRTLALTSVCLAIATAVFAFLWVKEKDKSPQSHDAITPKTVLSGDTTILPINSFWERYSIESNNQFKAFDFENVMNPAQAFDSVSRYRNGHGAQLLTKAIWYAPGIMVDYLNDKLPAMIRNHQKPAGFSWAVAMYPMMYEDPKGGGVFKLSFCVVPTLVNDKDPKVYHDYFNDIAKVYDKNMIQPYNHGHLEP